MTVILSAKAARQLEALLDYLETEWSPQSRRSFQNRLNRFIKILKTVPHGFPESERFPGCRKCVVTPQTSLVYRAQGNLIEIVSLIDNRQQ
ncbi:MAG: type II toxin-antitoxin system RelE/ParE family toxin [Saprospiraceae bacterium]|nr:type II toxin-antitoxin system RelE/ParE family toxin [Saprospiraceae bacterium]